MWKYFRREDFQCPHCGENHIQDELIDKLDIARDKAGIVFRINSGYRCKKHNKAVGGVSDSAHVKGLAADISMPDGFSYYCALLGLIQAGFNRIGFAKTFIHVDMDTTKPQDIIWHY